MSKDGEIKIRLREFISLQVLRRKFMSKIKQTVNLVFKAVGLAMGVAVTVLSVMGKIEGNTGFTLLGIGLTCSAISMFTKDDEDKN